MGDGIPLPARARAGFPGELTDETHFYVVKASTLGPAIPGSARCHSTVARDLLPLRSLRRASTLRKP